MPIAVCSQAVRQPSCAVEVHRAPCVLPVTTEVAGAVLPMRSYGHGVNRSVSSMRHSTTKKGLGRARWFEA